jgi:hypothetical protein
MKEPTIGSLESDIAEAKAVRIRIAAEEATIAAKGAVADLFPARDKSIGEVVLGGLMYGWVCTLGAVIYLTLGEIFKRDL